MKPILIFTLAALLAGCVTNNPPTCNPRTHFVAWQTPDGKIYEQQGVRGKWVVVPYGTIFYAGKPPL